MMGSRRRPEVGGFGSKAKYGVSRGSRVVRAAQVPASMSSSVDVVIRLDFCYDARTSGWRPCLDPLPRAASFSLASVLQAAKRLIIFAEALSLLSRPTSCNLFIQSRIHSLLQSHERCAAWRHAKPHAPTPSNRALDDHIISWTARAPASGPR